MLVQQFDMREGKVAALAFAFPLPLAVHVDFGHLHHVPHLHRKRGETMRHKLNPTVLSKTTMSHALAFIIRVS